MRIMVTVLAKIHKYDHGGWCGDYDDRHSADDDDYIIDALRVDDGYDMTITTMMMMMTNTDQARLRS